MFYNINEIRDRLTKHTTLMKDVRRIKDKPPQSIESRGSTKLNGNSMYVQETELVSHLHNSHLHMQT